MDKKSNHTRPFFAVAVISFVLILAVSGCRSKTLQTAEPEVVFVGEGKTHYFVLGAHHPIFVEINVDGSYLRYSGSSTGQIFVDDKGRWQQDINGVITIESGYARSNVIAHPLSIGVGAVQYIKYLPKVRSAIIRYLADNSTDSFPVNEWDELGIRPDDMMDVRVEGYWSKNPPTHVKRSQLKDLLDAIDRYLNDPAVRKRKAKILRYKGKTFLLPLNYGAGHVRDVKEITHAIDKGHMLRGFEGISEQEFDQNMKFLVDDDFVGLSSSEQELLKTGVVTTLDKPKTVGDQILVFESNPVCFLGGPEFRIRIWTRNSTKWPGENPQIIQVVDEEDRVITAKKVGGSPIMLKAWTANHSEKLFLYIKCKHRRGGIVDNVRCGSPDGTYIYEIGSDFSITVQGIHFDPDDIEKKKDEVRAIMKKLNEKPEKSDIRIYAPVRTDPGE